MKTLLRVRVGLVGVVFAASVTFGFSADAAFKLTIDDSAVAGTEMAVTLRAIGDGAAQEGRSIGVRASPIPSWAEALSFVGEVTGAAASPAASAGATPTQGDAAAGLILQLTDAAFAGLFVTPAAFNLDFSASRRNVTGAGSLVADLFADDEDVEFGAGADPVGFLSAADGSDAAPQPRDMVGLADPFSRSTKFLMAYEAKGTSPSEANTRIAPIPGSLVLFGSALLGLILTGRFGRRANATS